MSTWAFFKEWLLVFRLARAAGGKLLASWGIALAIVEAANDPMQPGKCCQPDRRLAEANPPDTEFACYECWRVYKRLKWGGWRYERDYGRSSPKRSPYDAL